MLRIAVVLITALAVPAAWGQMAISVRSGIIHHVEGDVALDGQPVKVEFGHFPMVPAGKILATKAGRAEIGLTPGVFLRLDENSSVRMISDALTNSQVEVVSGTALVEVAELTKQNSVSVRLGDSETKLLRPGLYHFDADAGRVRVYDGKAEVALDGKFTTLKKGREVTLGTTLLAGKFSTKDKDALYQWSAVRAGLVANANRSTAGGLMANGYRVSSSSWIWNSMFNMWTFMPMSGYIRSPFGLGWVYYSPYTVWQAYAPRYDNSGGGGGGFGAERGAWSGLGSGAGMRGASSGGSDMGGGSISRSGSAGSAAPAASSAPATSAGGARSR